MRRTPTITFTDACNEAKALARERLGGDRESCTYRVYAARPPQPGGTRAPAAETLSAPSTAPTLAPQAATPAVPTANPGTIDLLSLRESLRTEQLQEIKGQMATLTQTLVAEIRAQTPSHHPGVTQTLTHPRSLRPTHQPRSRGAAEGSQRFSSQFQWDDQGRPICVGCGVAGHTRRSCPDEMLAHRISSVLGRRRAGHRGRNSTP